MTGEQMTPNEKRLKALADDHFRNARDLSQRVATLQATVERQAAEIERLTREREQIAHNKRVNDAIQTAFERGELSFTSAGYLTGDTNAG